MRSNICKIEKGTRDLEAILNESERVAEYNGFSHKQSLQLRLICEEMDGMLPNIIDDFSGDFWIDYEDGVCKVNVSIQIPEFNTDKKGALIDISKNKKNSAVVGIVGKIRNAIEDFFLDEARMEVFDISSGSYGLVTGYNEGVDNACLWRLEDYRSTMTKEDHTKAWDELEKSVIASVADDVIVGVKGRRANIIIVKKFA
jgi:hypothetical protein